MDIETIVEEAAETLRLMPMMTDVPVVVENKGDMDDELKLKIAQQSVCVMVGWSGFTPTIQGPTAPNGEIFGSVTLVASVFEKPAVNRSTPGSPTCQDIAKAVAHELHGASAEGMDAPLFLKRITPVSELGSSPDGSVVTCDVEFETKTSI